MMKTDPWTVGLFATVMLAFGCSGSPESGSAEPQVFRGEYSYFADASAFVDCRDGTRYPVTGPENPTLERAYLEVAIRPGDSVLIEVEGRLEPRPAMEGDGSETALVVSRVVRVDGDARCTSESNADVRGAGGQSADLEDRRERD